MNYRDIIKSYSSLPWKESIPEDLILTSMVNAKEFSESLRITLELYPDEISIHRVATEELKTTNLSFKEFIRHADHSEFLAYFCKKHALTPSSRNIEIALDQYIFTMQSMTPTERAMTIFSREQEAEGIFTEFLNAHDWRAIGYDFYDHFIRKHLAFDAGESGHGELMKHLPRDEKVLKHFYGARLELYKVITGVN